MTKKYQVFVSSTFSDLEGVRKEVSQALLRTDCFPAGMELFPASDQSQLSFIKEVIDDSDIYLVITAGKYGTIDEETGLGFTELEYDYAVRQGKPVIALVHSNPFDLLTGKLIEQDNDKQELLLAFRKKLMTGRLVKMWSNAAELEKEVIFSILNVKNKYELEGWVKSFSGYSSFSSDTSMRMEIERQKKELERMYKTMDKILPLMMNLRSMSEKQLTQVLTNIEESFPDLDPNAYRSPMVGTVYLSQGPGVMPYVKEGDKVQKGQVILIIEAMKIVNQIEADHDGIVSKVYVENGQVVEYGQPLFKIN